MAFNPRTAYTPSGINSIFSEILQYIGHDAAPKRIIVVADSANRICNSARTINRCV